jgi:hypothetical protein
MKNFLILVSLSTAGILGVIQLQMTWQAGQNREELARGHGRGILSSSQQLGRAIARYLRRCLVQVRRKKTHSWTR